MSERISRLKETIKIRNYNKTDGEKVFELWQKTIGDKWPIDSQLFLPIINDSFDKTAHFVAEENGQLVGFIASRFGNLDTPKPKGSILLLIVHNAKQNKGIGKTLLDRAIQALKTKNIFDVQLGAGADTYFWPGVPENLPGAVSFFKARGWEYSEKSVDLVADLDKIIIPKDNSINEEITIAHPKESDSKSLLSFEIENFPSWYNYFNSSIKNLDNQNILIAKKNDGEIIGSVLLFGPYKSGFDANFKWKNIIGDKMGGFGALGVSNKNRGKGIGMTIAIKSTELLKERGVKSSYLGWT